MSAVITLHAAKSYSSPRARKTPAQGSWASGFWIWTLDFHGLTAVANKCSGAREPRSLKKVAPQSCGWREHNMQVSRSDFFSSLWLRKWKLKEKSSRKYKFIWNLLLWNHSDRKLPASSTYVHFIQLTDICKGCLQPSLLKSIVVNPIMLAILTVSLIWSNSFPWFKFCLEGKTDYLSIIT